MKINLRGDKLIVTESIKDYINSKINKLDKTISALPNLGKFFFS